MERRVRPNVVQATVAHAQPVQVHPAGNLRMDLRDNANMHSAQRGQMREVTHMPVASVRAIPQ